MTSPDASRTPPGRPPPDPVARSRAALRVALALLVALAALAAAWPAYRAAFDVEIDPNEGWNASFAEAAWGPRPLYPPAEGLIANNYPPLSFYVVGALGRLLGDPILAGRLLSFLGVALLALAAARLLALLGAGPAARVLAAALLVGTLCRFEAGYVGMNDPQLLAQGVMALGFAGFLRALVRDHGYLGPSFVMLLAGFAKHNLVALPLTAGLWLALERRRRLLPWALTLGGAAAAGLLLCRLVYGPDFVTNLTLPRASRGPLAALEALGRLSHVALVGLCSAGVLLLRLRGRPEVRRVLVWCAVALASLAVQRTGVGVSSNAGFDALLALSVAAGLLWQLLPEVTLPRGWTPATARLLLVGGACLRLMLATNVLPLRVLFDPGWRSEARAREEACVRAVAELRALPGEVLASAYLTFRAGKPFAVDPFSTRERIRAGRLPADVVEARLRAGTLTAYAPREPVTWSGLPR